MDGCIGLECLTKRTKRTLSLICCGLFVVDRIYVHRAKSARNCYDRYHWWVPCFGAEKLREFLSEFSAFKYSVYHGEGKGHDSNASSISPPLLLQPWALPSTAGALPKTMPAEICRLNVVLHKYQFKVSLDKNFHFLSVLLPNVGNRIHSVKEGRVL